MGTPMRKMVMPTYTHGMFLSICSAWLLEPNHRISIRLPHSEMALGFNGGYAGAQVSRNFSAHRSHSNKRQHSSSLQKMRTT